ncbi:hypothetical protein, partial [Microbacterium sp.]|uniref:hypothetical protein n=1 Tax=Microbacterium sp. TaxID=51671 RepID=UPI003A8B9E73
PAGRYWDDGCMRRTFEVVTVGAVVAHHAIETAAGLGLPGEPFLGRRRAVFAWTGVFAANLLLLRRKGRLGEGLVGFANGAYQALALQHYVDSPWKLRFGVPVLTEAEGLPHESLAPYNAALLTVTASSTAAVIASRRHPAVVIGHLLGLATLPLQLASARHHVGWFRAAR